MMRIEPNNFRFIEFNINGNNIHVAGMAHPGYADTAGIISFLNDNSFKFLISTEVQKTATIKRACHIQKSPQHITLEVDDFSAPSPDQFNFFIKLLNTLEDQDKIAIHCMGGNGRTGTFMAAAALLELFFNNRSLFDSEIRKDHIVNTYGDKTRTSLPVYLAIEKVRSIRNGKHSVECPTQVEALYELQTRMPILLTTPLSTSKAETNSTLITRLFGR